MLVRINGGTVGVYWPPMIYSTHLLVMDGGQYVYGTHGPLGMMKSITVTTFSGTYVITPNYVYLENQRAYWGQSFSSGTTSLRGSNVAFFLPSGIRVTVQKVDDAQVMIHLDSLRGLSYSNGLLARAMKWRLDGRRDLLVPDFGTFRRFRTVDTQVGTMRCRATQTDIFDILGIPQRA